MRANTVGDLGALVRSTRRAQGLTQAALAARLGVGRDWVVRLEQGHPRLEAQRVLDALAVLDLTLDVTESTARSPTLVTARIAPVSTEDAASTTPGRSTTAAVEPQQTAKDPFDALFEGR